MLATGRARLEGNTPGFWQSIAHIKIAYNLTKSVFKNCKTIMEKVIPGYTFTFCIEKAFDIGQHFTFWYSRNLKDAVWHSEDCPEAYVTLT